VEAKFTGLDRKTRLVTLSIRAKEVHEEAQAMESYRSESGSGSGTTLGDLLKGQMSGQSDD
jgi:small subunit ribosomal protein S1